MLPLRRLPPRSLVLLSLLGAVGCAAPIGSESQAPNAALDAASPVALDAVPSVANAAPPVASPVPDSASRFQSQASLTALATHLNQSGAKVYKAFWCPYCKKQAQLFGSAQTSLPAVECDPQGKNPQTALCSQKAIQGFPTWEINGQLYPGMRDANDLADLSGYAGPRN